tara:strand:+ start:1293 stop:1553 length:261 start_codon:yes stop_codon:yes gene_type:complete
MVNGELIALTDAEIAEMKANAPTDAEILARKWQQIRAERNQKLFETDWRATSDRTLSDAWRDYRQALRDVPAQTDVDNIVWPTEPS